MNTKFINPHIYNWRRLKLELTIPFDDFIKIHTLCGVLHIHGVKLYMQHWEHVYDNNRNDYVITLFIDDTYQDVWFHYVSFYCMGIFNTFKMITKESLD